MVAFSGLSKSYCIGIVDMVESTKISAEMNEMADLYQNIKEINDYQYSQKKGFSIGFKYSYPVYEVNRP